MITSPQLSSFSNKQLDQIRAQRSHQIKLVYFDIDGTLLDSNAELPASAAKQIARIQAKGIKTAIASGRAVFAAQSYIQQYSINHAGIFYTGAVLFDPADNKLLASYSLAFDDIQQVIQIARQQQMHCELYTIDNYYIEAPTRYTDFHTHYLKQAPVVSPFSQELIRQGIYKIQLVVDESTELEKLAAVQKKLPHLTFASGHGADRPELIFSSVVSAEADKNAGFDNLCNYHNLKPAEIMSIGDAGSDKVFLQAAGIGIAMGNASDDVKACADYVTHHVDNNGLANALELLL